MNQKILIAPINVDFDFNILFEEHNGYNIKLQEVYELGDEHIDLFRIEDGYFYMYACKTPAKLHLIKSWYIHYSGFL